MKVEEEGFGFYLQEHTRPADRRTTACSLFCFLATSPPLPLLAAAASAADVAAAVPATERLSALSSSVDNSDDPIGQQAEGHSNY